MARQLEQIESTAQWLADYTGQPQNIYAMDYDGHEEYYALGDDAPTFDRGPVIKRIEPNTSKK